MDFKEVFLDFPQMNAALHNSKIVYSSDNFKRYVAAPQHLLRWHCEPSRRALVFAMRVFRSCPVKIAA